MLSRKLKASIVGLLAAGLIACTPSQIQTSESLITVILQDVPPILTMLAGMSDTSCRMTVMSDSEV